MGLVYSIEPSKLTVLPFGDPDILYWWRHWFNVSEFIDEQDERYTLEAFGAEELAMMEEQAEL